MQIDIDIGIPMDFAKSLKSWIIDDSDDRTAILLLHSTWKLTVG